MKRSKLCDIFRKTKSKRDTKSYFDLDQMMMLYLKLMIIETFIMSKLIIQNNKINVNAT